MHRIAWPESVRKIGTNSGAWEAASSAIGEREAIFRRAGFSPGFFLSERFLPFFQRARCETGRAEAGAKAELLVVLGETVDSYSASFCQGAGTDSAEPESGKHHRKQNCPLCQALQDFQNSLPPCIGAILLTHDAGKSPCISAARCASRPRIERAGQPRAPPSLYEVDVV